jgi:hypothetical protein
MLIKVFKQYRELLKQFTLLIAHYTSLKEEKKERVKTETDIGH